MFYNKGDFVLEAGLEPARPNGHRILSPACLPIPPLELKRGCLIQPGLNKNTEKRDFS